MFGLFVVFRHRSFLVGAKALQPQNSLGRKNSAISLPNYSSEAWKVDLRKEADLRQWLGDVGKKWGSAWGGKGQGRAGQGRARGLEHEALSHMLRAAASSGHVTAYDAKEVAKESAAC